MTAQLNSIKDGDVFTVSAWVKAKSLLTSKAGKPYLALRLGDTTGECDARIWDNIDTFTQRFDAGSFVTATGRMVRHQGHLQAHLSDIEKLEGEIDYTRFLPATRGDTETMYSDLLALIRHEVDDTWVRAILLKLFEDPQIALRYKCSPAAKTHHHAYLGGLLEHSLGLARLGLSVLPHYPKVNKSIVIAGLLCHDIGKIDELSYTDGFNYTPPGKLIGHLVMGIELLTAKAREIPDFPAETLMLLKHTIAGHHGQIEYGSPVLPQTLEAIIVHFLDNMDSKLAAMTELLEKEMSHDGLWTTFNAMYGRTMYKTDPFRRAFAPAAAAKEPNGPVTHFSEKRNPTTPLSVSLADKFATVTKQKD